MTTIPPRTLLSAYASGVFPMADSAEDMEVYWVEPKRRAILPLDGFHLSRTLARTIRRGGFRVTTDRCFAEVMDACAAPAEGRETTWINAVIRDSYIALHRLGHAHSVECWQGARLVGGLYGVSLGTAFFGESMFSRATDASKTALAWLVARLRVGRFTLLDCQFITDHLASLGAVEMPQATYLKLLYPAVSPALASAAGAAGELAFVAGAGADGAGDWGALDRVLAAAAPVAGASPSAGAATSPGQLIVQLLTNTS
jgi:leucyl/phenylalanyl-tRNA--protein transferase